MLLTKEQILAQRLPTERVEIPWLDGGEVIVRALPQYVINAVGKLANGVTQDAFVFVNGVIDENGQRLWKDEEAQVVQETIDSSLIAFITAAIWRVTEIPAERQEEIKKKLPKMLADAIYGASQSPSDTPIPT